MSLLSNSAGGLRALDGVESAPEAYGELDALRINLARSLIGRTVDLLVAAETITRGVVIGVFTEAGMPKLVVGGMVYDPHQVLTVTQSALTNNPSLNTYANA